MKIKSYIAKPLATITKKRIEKESKKAISDQEKILKYLVKSAQKTIYGQDHNFSQIKSYEDFVKNVPIGDYESLKPYIQLILEGKDNVLWKGKPLYFAKTSGTTSGVKYIPISKESIGNHINTARVALMNYMSISGNNQFADGKMIFLSGAPTLERKGNIPTGRLSGIVNHHIPRYLRNNQLPSFETNCIEDWETKLDKIIEETINEDLTLISGIPPWMQMYFDKLIQRSGKKNIKEIFPNLSVLVQGGVNFEPYKQKIFESIGQEIDIIETYPASEGFIAFQDQLNDNSLLLNTNSGIFFEFIPLENIYDEAPKRLKLSDIELEKNYALIINNNAGLWGYNIGDTIKFVSKDPFRIKVTGRIKHFISAFGEHVIGEEVEYALKKTLEKHNASVVEFTVAPYISQDQGKSFHEWFLEFDEKPIDLETFSEDLDNQMRQKNIYYNDLISGNILHKLKINVLPKNAFINYMKSIGKLGGQNKVPRLSNDRNIANDLIALNKIEK